jgi:predicted Ser/Thr protein kinase
MEGMASRKLLKRDALGAVYLLTGAADPVVVRDVGAARPGCRWLARRLALREARMLEALADMPGTPTLLGIDASGLARSFLPGEPMYVRRPVSSAFFKNALTLVRRMHRAGVAHNDLAKEANWICLAGQDCGIVDFQLAIRSKRRSALFRVLAREDIRHLLKHKEHYIPERLTARERSILASPSCAARFWRTWVKPPYLLFTRRVLGWPERTGPEERGTPP